MLVSLGSRWPRTLIAAVKASTASSSPKEGMTVIEASLQRRRDAFGLQRQSLGEVAGPACDAQQISKDGCGASDSRTLLRLTTAEYVLLRGGMPCKMLANQARQKGQPQCICRFLGLLGLLGFLGTDNYIQLDIS